MRDGPATMEADISCVKLSVRVLNILRTNSDTDWTFDDFPPCIVVNLGWFQALGWVVSSSFGWGAPRGERSDIFVFVRKIVKTIGTTLFSQQYYSTTLLLSFGLFFPLRVKLDRVILIGSRRKLFHFSSSLVSLRETTQRELELILEIKYIRNE